MATATKPYSQTLVRATTSRGQRAPEMMLQELFLLEPDFDELGCCDPLVITGNGANTAGRRRIGDDEPYPFD